MIGKIFLHVFYAFYVFITIRQIENGCIIRRKAIYHFAQKSMVYNIVSLSHSLKYFCVQSHTNLTRPFSLLNFWLNHFAWVCGIMDSKNLRHFWKTVEKDVISCSKDIYKMIMQANVACAFIKVMSSPAELICRRKFIIRICMKQNKKYLNEDLFRSLNYIVMKSYNMILILWLINVQYINIFVIFAFEKNLFDTWMDS